jgi:hypothetical protein
MKMKDDLVCNYSDARAVEIVLFDTEVSYGAHRELFRFDPDKYVSCENSPVAFLQDISISPGKVHLSLTWENVLGVALWKDRINIGETVLLLKDTGLSDAELTPFRNGSINDIFPVLYYGKHFDVLRKVCNIAKKRAQDKLRSSGIQIQCHMVSEEIGRIVASSL